MGEGVGSISTGGNPLTPTLSPNERERSQFAARSSTAYEGVIRGKTRHWM
jgi:hypothetical protein